VTRKARTGSGGVLGLLAVLAFLAILLVLGTRLNAPVVSSSDDSPAGVESSVSSGLPAATLLTSVPQKVYDVLDIVETTGAAPDGYRGGQQFMNDGRDGGQVLPRRDATGKSITYREWDVNPYTGANRGTERLVTGSDGSAWYTDDHYDTFVRIR
jgi:guanyl-specific ribonuclease Sa